MPSHIQYPTGAQSSFFSPGPVTGVFVNGNAVTFTTSAASNGGVNVAISPAAGRGDTVDVRFTQPVGSATVTGPLVANAYVSDGGDDLIINKAAGASTVFVTVPDSTPGRVTVVNGDGLTPTAVSALHRPPAIRMTDSTTKVVLPSVTLGAAADTGWTLGVLVRLNAENLQTGTTHLQFLKIGTGSAYAHLSYEGPNATNPFVMKLLLPNAAATGVVSARQGLSSVYSPFHTSRLGQWAWIFVRKHPAALVENVLSLSTGAEISASFVDETVTLAWAPIQQSDPTGVVVYAGSSGVAAGTFSVATAALNVGPDASNTGTFDVAKVFFMNQVLSAAQLGKMATGKRPHDVGITPVDATDVYYDLTSTTAANLLDLCGGTAATSVTLGGSDALTPTSDRPVVNQYMGTTGNTKLEVVFADQLARAI